MKVSLRLNDKHDIRKLFTFLRIDGHIIEAIFKKNLNDTSEIAHELMTELRKRMKTPAEAYTKLWNALTDQEVNLASIAHEVLKEPPTDNISAQPPDGGKLSTIINNQCKRILNLVPSIGLRKTYLSHLYPPWKENNGSSFMSFFQLKGMISSNLYRNCWSNMKKVKVNPVLDDQNLINGGIML